MEYTQSVNNASGLNQPHLIQSNTPEKESDTNNSILSLVNKLEFNIDEKDKEQFFKELEAAMTSELEQENQNNYHEIINFFIKHTKPNGKISA